MEKWYLNSEAYKRLNYNSSVVLFRVVPGVRIGKVLFCMPNLTQSKFICVIIFLSELEIFICFAVLIFEPSTVVLDFYLVRKKTLSGFRGLHRK